MTNAKPDPIERQRQAVADAEQKLKQAKARLQAATARKRAADAAAERKADTRRKILLGAMLLAEADTPDKQAALFARVGRTLIRDDDRALFGLPALLPSAGTEGA